jgi:hypothetical protein
VALLPQLGTHQQCETTRRLLRNLHYDEASICARTRISSIFDFKTLGQGRTTASALNDGLDALIRLLLDGEQLTDVRLRYLLPEETLSCLEALRLIVQMGRVGDLFGTVRLAPVEGLFIASDRLAPIDPELLMGRSFFVPDPISWKTGAFLKMLPRQDCESLLALCCGSGVAALVCARQSGRVWACDAESRGVHFTEFNAGLNGVDNVTCARSDLYEAVKKRTFDRIVAHPRFLSYGDGYRMRNAADDEGEVLRGIIEGLPLHLRPGGLFFTVSLAPSGEGRILSDRIVQWLGNHQSEFEIAVALTGDAAKRPPDAAGPCCATISIVRH